jgi:hypothetical protein
VTTINATLGGQLAFARDDGDWGRVAMIRQRNRKGSLSLARDDSV